MSNGGPGGSGIEVVGIVGSLRTVSFTRMAVREALAGAAEYGARTRILDLADYDLPFCSGYIPEDAVPESVQRLREDLRPARGILLGTPEYHGGVSGVLKNALDLMGFAEFEGKMIGLIGVSGGQLGATDALNALRGVGRALHAWVVPEQAAISRAREAFDAEGRVRSPEMAERLRVVGRQVAEFAMLHTAAKTDEFLRLWEHAPVNPGGPER